MPKGKRKRSPSRRKYGHKSLKTKVKEKITNSHVYKETARDIDKAKAKKDYGGVFKASFRGTADLAEAGLKELGYWWAVAADVGAEIGKSRTKAKRRKYKETKKKRKGKSASGAG